MMIWCGRGSILVALVFFCCRALAAQGPSGSVSTADPTTQFVLTQRSSGGYRTKIQDAILTYEKSLEAHCKNVSLDFDSSGAQFKILAPLYRNEENVAVAGSWRETVPGTACGEEHKFNVRVDATLSGLEFTATFPGDAAGDPDLQHDTLKSIEATFDSQGISTKKSCHLEVIDTHLLGPEPSLQSDGNLSPWKESWDVRTCGTTYSVPITYAAGGQGIEIHASDIKTE